MSNLHEECGVFGIYLPNGARGVVGPTYHALYALQHRGQESCGIAVNTDGVITCHKDVGLVGDVFTAEVLDRLRAAGAGGTWAAVATAHPAKFPDVVEPLLGQTVPLPAPLAAMLARPSRAQPLANDDVALRDLLRRS